MQSAYHNLPTINGVMQKNGREYHAENVELIQTANQKGIKLDISKAYPKESNLIQWTRSVIMQDEASISSTSQKNSKHFNCILN